MSYILDALKKAEAERNAGTRPSIHAPLPFAAPGAYASTGSPRPLVWIATATAVIAGGALAWWLLPREHPVRLTSPVPQAAAPAPVPVPAPAAPQQAAPTHEEPAHAGKPPLKAERKTPEKKTITEAPTPKSPKPEKPAEPGPANSDAALPTLRELPDGIRTQVPSLTIAGFIYSASKADRSVLINNRLLREGDEVAPGLRLERMGPNWMVLDWHGTRFRHSY
jgi:general secretion pathway protein B